MRTEKAAISKASEKTTKLAEAVNLPDSPPLAKGQGAAVLSNSMANDESEGPPPTNGVSDGLHRVKPRHHSGHPTLRESVDTHQMYDVAAAEAQAEEEDEASLDHDLGQGQP